MRKLVYFFFLSLLGHQQHRVLTLSLNVYLLYDYSYSCILLVIIRF